MLITQQWHIYRDGLIVAWSRPRHLRLISIHVKYRSGQNNRNIPFRREKRNAEPFIPFLLKFWLFRLIPSDPARVQTCRLQIRPTQMGYPARPGTIKPCVPCLVRPSPPSTPLCPTGPVLSLGLLSRRSLVMAPPPSGRAVSRAVTRHCACRAEPGC